MVHHLIEASEAGTVCILCRASHKAWPVPESKYRHMRYCTPLGAHGGTLCITGCHDCIVVNEATHFSTNTEGLHEEKHQI